MTNEGRFREFHAANPGVYAELVRMARDLVGRGHPKLGIAMLWEVLRWRSMRTDTTDSFKLNNNHRAYYARLIMEREPDLDGVFGTRVQHTAPWESAPAQVDVHAEQRLF